MKLRAPGNQNNHEKLLKYFFLYLFSNLAISWVLIVLQYDSGSVGNIMFSTISFILPLTQIIETVYYRRDCIKFIQEAATLQSDYNLISPRTALKIALMLGSIMVQIVLISVRCYLCDIECGPCYRLFSGVVQLLKYLRLIQLIIFVSIVNDRLEFLEKSMRQLNNHPSHKSTEYYLSVENQRFNYSAIWKLHNFVNSYFGTTLLLNTVSAFLTGGFNIYTTIAANSNSLLHMSDPFQSFAHIIFIYVVIIHSCEKSESLAHKIYRNISFDFCLESKEFAMQINYHQKFVYTACNFFFINYQLLFSAFSVMTSYIVILIQLIE